MVHAKWPLTLTIGAIRNLALNPTLVLLVLVSKDLGSTHEQSVEVITLVEKSEHWLQFAIHHLECMIVDEQVPDRARMTRTLMMI
jgi:hypothetical protein